MHLSRSRRPGAVLLACGAAALALLAAPAPASAASSTCDASPLRASLLGGPPIEPVTANRGQPTCRTVNAQGEERGALLAAGTLTARTTLTPDGRAEAMSEIASLQFISLPELPPGVGVVEIPSPLPLLLPGPIRLDLRRALQDLLPGGLLSVRAVRSTATARCVAGTPQLAGASEIAGISLAGIELPTDRVLERTLDLSGLDVALIDLPLVPPALTGLVRSVLAPVLSTLLPPSLVTVRIAPGEQVREAGRLIQRALHAQVSVFGEPVADIVAGEAAAGVQCGGTRSSAGLTRNADGAPADLALACTKRDLVLIDVVPGRRRVQLLGAADHRFVGRRVRIVFTATGQTAATATVGPDRLFRTTATLPPRALRGTNRARYQAVIDDERSLRLKLMRRMQVRRIASAGGKVTIAGRVVRPLGRPRQEVVVRRRVSCRDSEVVGRFTPARDGTFEVTVPTPAGVGAAVYRLTTRVRKRPHRPKLFPTFTLPRVVEVAQPGGHYTS